MEALRRAARKLTGATGCEFASALRLKGSGQFVTLMLLPLDGFHLQVHRQGLVDQSGTIGSAFRELRGWRFKHNDLEA